MWSYFRNPFIEFGIPDRVSRKPLKPHVHANLQAMVVTKGSRRVHLGGQTVYAPAHSLLIIPPGMAHAADECGWDGFNAYIDPSIVCDPVACLLRFATLPPWTFDIRRQSSSCDIQSVLSLISEGKIVWSEPGLSQHHPAKMEVGGWPQSREGHIRRYRREAGISPHAHFKALQLDRARHMIANGEALASVAAELGFTDQSHLGRQFQASFGISPGRYAAG